MQDPAVAASTRARRPGDLAEAGGARRCSPSSASRLWPNAVSGYNLRQINPAIHLTDTRDNLSTALAGRYLLEQELGRGGMATVYLVTDLKHDRPVALKVLRPELAASLGPERFLREIRLTARLDHPHILPVLDSGEAAGLLWYTMPYVRGETLRDRLNREIQLPVEIAVDLTRQVASALDYAHREGVVHRDLKPENILLADGQARVADFGIAKALAGAGDSTLTDTGLAVGTPAYMSPEQASGSPVDARTDVYALGCVLYEMLAGEPPYTGPSAQAIMSKRFVDPVPQVRRMRSAVPPHLEDALTKALAPLAADRFATAAELERCLTGPVSSPAPLPARETSLARLRRAWTVALAVALGLIAAGGGFLWLRGERVGGQNDPTRLAVLPFENQGAAEDEYFADGMTDAVRGKLSALPTLQVTARQSSAAYKHSTKKLKEIGQELGVQYLLTATVRWEKHGDESRVQVSPELVEVSTASTRWQQPFDASMTSIFEVQGTIAGRVAEALHLALGAEERQALTEMPTQNLAAYDAFLRGEAATQSLGAGDAASVRRALPLYQAAVALDTAFALAWARLAVAHAGLYLYESPVPAEAEAAKRALARAEALAPNSPETFAAREHYEGWVRLDWTRALAAAEAGLQRYPSHPDLVLGAGLAERSLGRYEVALEHLTRAQELNPRSLGVVRRRGETLLYLRRWPVARRVLGQAHSIAPQDLYTLQLLAMTHLGAGDLGEARQVVAAAPHGDRVALAVMLALYGDLYWMLDEQAQISVLNQPVGAFNNYPIARAMVRAQLYHLRGDTSLTRAWADTARQAIREQLRAVPDDAQLHAFLGLVAAYLGRKAEAVEEGKRATALLPVTRDAFNGPYVQHQLVRIYILAGEPEKALDQLEPLLRIPYYVSPGWLRLDPTFDPLRGNPRFERLVAGG